LTAGTLLLAFRIARRELRGGIRGLRVFLACLVLGVTAIAGIGSLGDSVVAGIITNARVPAAPPLACRRRIPPTAQVESLY
jgi:predicted lysophospholipase L1 biosynthesis ABC-type transport system permease subunit